MTYNMTFMDSANTLFDIFQGVDSIKAGWFGGFVLLSFFIITLAIFQNKNPYNVILVDSFAVTFVAFLMYSNGMIGVMHITICLVILLASIVMKLWADHD